MLCYRSFREGKSLRTGQSKSFLEEERIVLSLKYRWLLIGQEEGKTVRVRGMVCTRVQR